MIILVDQKLVNQNYQYFLIPKPFCGFLLKSTYLMEPTYQHFQGFSVVCTFDSILYWCAHVCSTNNVRSGLWPVRMGFRLSEF